MRYQFINKLTGEVNLFDLAKFVIRGGWPGNLEVGDDNISLVTKSYIESILKEDAQQLDEVKYDKHKLRLLLRSLARNESTTASNKKLLNDIINEEKEKIDIGTVSSYLNLFERLFLIDNLQPFLTNIRSSIRVKQQEKRHFCDPSLAASLLNLTPIKLIN